MPLPGLRPGVVLVGEGDDAELRDMQLGQVVKLGAVASVVVSLLDATRDAEALLRDAAEALGEELNPLGLVELLQALDRRALLDTPRALMIVAQGLVRADIAALQRLARRPRQVSRVDELPSKTTDVSLAADTAWSCNSCVRCCSEQHLIGTVTREERDNILKGFVTAGNDRGSDPSNFVPLPSNDDETRYLLRPRDGVCSFLDDDRKCLIHKVLGEASKPSSCRLFPFRGVLTPDGWDVGVTLNCPTAAAGAGPDATPAARTVLSSLQVLHPDVLKVPPQVRIAEDETVAWSRYKAWEDRAIARLLDADSDPGDSWLKSIRDFAALVAEAGTENLSLDPDETIEDELTAPTSEVSLLGLNELELEVPSPGEMADVLLRELSIWAELLVGLEASDPGALRRFRSGITRLRMAVGEAEDAPAVLAENKRLAIRKERSAGRPDDLDLEPITGITLGEKTDAHAAPVLVEPPPGSADLQRRFLVQALKGKQAFEFGTVARGLLSLSVFVGVLRLQTIDGDELQPTYRDISYLLNHDHLTDVFDTRAVVRSSQIDPAVHAALAGLA